MNNIKDIARVDDLNCGGKNCASIIYRKLEKITMAVYLVTGLFSDDEPLKKILREQNISLMSFIMSLTKNPASLDEDIFLRITNFLSEIESSLKIALVSNLISEMNHSILMSEYKKILGMIKGKKKEGVGRKINLTEIFLLDDKGHLHKGQENFVKGQIDVVEKKLVNKKNKKEKIKDENEVRKNLILSALKDKQEASIKDISKIVKNCSEKTLQRELVILMNEGVIGKKGERRWSRYFLKNK